jgi:DNA-binding GntR family transcriptional regulator
MQGFANQTLWERVYLYLKQEILENRMPPGTVISEVPLSEALGVSRGPIREAIGRLAAEGLVTVTPRKGTVVTALTKRDFLEAYQVREALEALAVTLAVPRLTADDFAELDRLMDEMDLRAAEGDVTAFFDANAAFHEAFVVASGNAKLLEMYRLLIGQMGPYRRPSAALRGSLAVSIAEHTKIMDAARAREAQGTADLVLDHIRVPQRRLQKLSEEEFIAEVTRRVSPQGDGAGGDGVAESPPAGAVPAVPAEAAGAPAPTGGHGGRRAAPGA